MITCSSVGDAARPRWPPGCPQCGRSCSPRSHRRSGCSRFSHRCCRWNQRCCRPARRTRGWQGCWSRFRSWSRSLQAARAQAMTRARMSASSFFIRRFLHLSSSTSFQPSYSRQGGQRPGTIQILQESQWFDNSQFTLKYTKKQGVIQINFTLSPKPLRPNGN